MQREYTDNLLATVNPAENGTTPQAILHAVYSAIVQGDYAAYGAMLADDVLLSINGFGPMDGAWHGRDDVVRATRNNFSLVEEQKPEIETMIAQGDSIAVLLRERGVHKSSGQPYSIRCVQWFTFAAGKIKRVDQIVANV
jgi:ketosteroid isomerase-like protein